MPTPEDKLWARVAIGLAIFSLICSAVSNALRIWGH